MYLASISVFRWAIDCFRKTNKKGLEVDDLYKLSENDKSAYVTDILESCWRREMEKTKKNGGKPCLVKAMFNAFGKNYMLWGAVSFIQMMSR